MDKSRIARLPALLVAGLILAFAVVCAAPEKTSVQPTTRVKSSAEKTASKKVVGLNKGRFITLKALHDRLQKGDKSLLFVDIRDPAEVFTVGAPLSIDFNVPFKFLNTRKWNMKKSTFQLIPNKGFTREIGVRLMAKGLDSDAEIILLCGSGKRSSKAVAVLRKEGFKNALFLKDGYKGWKKLKFKWSKKLDKSKMYMPRET